MFSFVRVVATIALCALAQLSVPAAISPAWAVKAEDPSKAPVQQLRIYEIYDHNKAAFIERFRDHAVRIMDRYGFQIVAMWESRHEGRPEFVYVLRWGSEEQMKASWQKFMADAEWADIKKRTSAQHGKLVGTIQDRVLHPVPRADLAAVQ